jgi:hypothetical protein
MEISSQEKILIQIVNILNESKIDYFITGGFAVCVWGRPRATFDIDIVVKMIEPQANLLVKMFRQIVKAGYADENMVKDAIRNKGEFNFIDPNSGIKVDFWVVGKSEDYIREFDNRKTKKINKEKVCFISPEDLILNKLDWYKKTDSDKHLKDAKSVLEFSEKYIDKAYLKEWAIKLKLMDNLNKII